MSDVKLCNEFISFIADNPTVFHAAAEFGRILEANGFVYLAERESWEAKIQLGGKYYTTRNGSSLVAFIVGDNYKFGNGVGLVGCHLDANCLKLKPISAKDTVQGFRQLGAAFYGGPNADTWWDRDLSIGGRVIVRSKNGTVTSKLCHIPYPIARIPTLAPHFGAPARGPFNPETQMTPIIGLASSGTNSGDAGHTDEPTASEKQSPVVGKHDIRLLRAIAKNIDVPLENIVQLELELFDSQKGVIGGLDQEFLFCPRLDDKLCSYAAIRGLINSGGSRDAISMVALFDNEEIGSLLRQGAKGHLVEMVVDRILRKASPDVKSLTYSNSFFVSSDVTHAVNPNFTNAYLESHMPKLNTGMVVKLDPNGHTTSNSISTALAEAIARKAGLELQYFHIRNDSRSGGTIGPALSSATGMRSVDCGIPQLSMHSVRATTGTQDLGLGVKFFTSFFDNWTSIDDHFKRGGL